jgi:hypothetical protein
MSEYPFTISTYDASKRNITFLSSSGETLLTISSAGIVFNSDIPTDDLAKEVISIIEKDYLIPQEADHVSDLRTWQERAVPYVQRRFQLIKKDLEFYQEDANFPLSQPQGIGRDKRILDITSELAELRALLLEAGVEL